MPLFLWLGTLLGTLLTSVVTFFFSYMTKRLLIIAAVVVAIAAVTVAFFAAVYTLMATVIAASPPFFSMACSLVLPENFPFILSVWLSARLLRWVYEWNVKVIQYRLF